MVIIIADVIADQCTDAYLSPQTLFMQGMSGNVYTCECTCVFVRSCVFTYEYGGNNLSLSLYIYIYIYIYTSYGLIFCRGFSSLRHIFLCFPHISSILLDFHALFQCFLTFREESPATNQTMLRRAISPKSLSLSIHI